MYFSYQWLAAGNPLDHGVHMFFTPTQNEVGMNLRVVVSFTDDDRYKEARSSQSTSPVQAGGL